MASIRERTTKGGERTWAVLYRHGGRQTSKTFVVEKKAVEFKALCEAIGPERALQVIQGDQPETQTTVGEMAAQFLAWKSRPGEVTPRTLADYRRDYANWVEPWFGDRAAELVNEADVQKWVDHMARRLSPKSVADRHMLLNSIYKFGKARSRRLVTHNPCEETELPKATRRPPKGATLGEWGAILEAAATRNPDAHDLILFLGTLGWRWSEAAALAVRGIEDDGEHVWVDVTRVFRVIDNRQVLVEDAAKSYAGFRRSRVTPELAEMFRRRIVGKGPNDYVFTNSRGRHWSQHTFLRDTWPGLLKAAKVGSEDRKPTPHWLRHMAVANMARAGIPMHEIQRIIGHEDLKTTNSIYGKMVSTLSERGVVDLAAVTAQRRTAARTVAGEVVAGEVVAEAVAELA